MSVLPSAPQTTKRPFRMVRGVSTMADLDLAPVACAASILTVTEALHAGRLVTLSLAAGIAVTLPATTGRGNLYRFHVLTTFTGASSIKVANATDVMQGMALLGIDGGTLVPHLYPTGSTADTIDLLGTGNSTGGIFGEYIELEDVAVGYWRVLVIGDAAGTEATPFSATVS